MVYLLGRQPSRDDGQSTDDYFLCSLHTDITSKCSTRYNASSSGQTLEALCGPKDGYDGPRRDWASQNWRDIGFGFVQSMDLNTGMFNLSSSYARTLTQLQLMTPDLNPTLPSAAEGLVSMATCTALDLTKDYPFVPFWVSHALLGLPFC